MSTVKWKLDPSHSEVEFKVKHLMIANVSGSFREFDVAAESDDERFNDPKVTFTAKTASIDTKNEQRDAHLKSADFFDAESFPEIRFVSTWAHNHDAEGNFDLTGNLTIRDVTKEVTFKVEFGGVGKDPWGNSKAGFSVSGRINRADFGLTWNAALESGGVLVSDEIRIACEIQLVQSA
jgi:polyisoprenoid-binding protein YceI